MLVPGTGLELEASSGGEQVSDGDARESAAEIPSEAEGPQAWCREQDLNLRRLAGVSKSPRETRGSPLPKSRAKPRDLAAGAGNRT